jgi:hypothetical protein
VLVLARALVPVPVPVLDLLSFDIPRAVEVARPGVKRWCWR